MRMISDAQLQEALARAREAGVPLHPKDLPTVPAGAANAYGILRPVMESESVAAVRQHVSTITTAIEDPEAKACYHRVMDALRGTRGINHYCASRHWGNAETEDDDLRFLLAAIRLVLVGSQAFEPQRIPVLVEVADLWLNLIRALGDESGSIPHGTRCLLLTRLTRGVAEEIRRDPTSNLSLLLEPVVTADPRWVPCKDIFSADILRQIVLLRNLDHLGGWKRLLRLIASDRLKHEPHLDWDALPTGKRDRKQLLEVIGAYIEIFTELGETTLLDPQSVIVVQRIVDKIPKKSDARGLLEETLKRIRTAASIERMVSHLFHSTRVWVMAGQFYSQFGRWPATLDEARSFCPRLVVGDEITYQLKPNGPEITLPPALKRQVWPSWFRIFKIVSKYHFLRLTAKLWNKPPK